MSRTVHRPVLVEAVVAGLAIKPGGVYVDATLGGGGYAEAILRAGASHLIGLDWDQAAIDRTRGRLASFGDRVNLQRAGFMELENVLNRIGFSGVDGVTADLGLSSDQLAEAERGFSFSNDGPLDMRMDQRRERSAADIVNTAEETELVEIIRSYGEEKQARRAARAIVAARTEEPIETTGRLAEVIARAIGQGRREGRTKIHPATKTFQALRLAVNRELDQLAGLLDCLPRALNPGGRAVIVSYHSLEDRLVKNSFRDLAKSCTCPPKAPCICGGRATYRLIGPKPLKPSQEEINQNPRARSARLRIAERI